MFYRIKFKAAPEEYVFELGDVKYKVIVSDVIRVIKDKFKIRNANLVLFDENSAMLETDEIHNARTYIVKRVPKYSEIRNARVKKNDCGITRTIEKKNM